MLENYGTKRTGFVLWSKKQHSDNTRQQWENYTPEQREIRVLQIIKNMMSGSRSGIQTIIGECLHRFGLDVIPSFMIGRNEYDFYIKNYNLILEVNGDFWHANPNKYKSDDILPFPNSIGVRAADLWKKDEFKKKKAIDKGYKILYIWESDIRNNINLDTYVLQLLKQSDENQTNNQDRLSI